MQSCTNSRASFKNKLTWTSECSKNGLLAIAISMKISPILLIRNLSKLLTNLGLAWFFLFILAQVIRVEVSNQEGHSIGAILHMVQSKLAKALILTFGLEMFRTFLTGNFSYPHEVLSDYTHPLWNWSDQSWFHMRLPVHIGASSRSGPLNMPVTDVPEIWHDVITLSKWSSLKKEAKSNWVPHLAVLESWEHSALLHPIQSHVELLLISFTVHSIQRVWQKLLQITNSPGRSLLVNRQMAKLQT